jgi:hypothetical protein
MLGTAVLGHGLGLIGVSMAIVIGAWLGVSAAFWCSGVGRGEPVGALTRRL